MLNTSPPRRLRHSYEARCRLVQRIEVDGLAPVEAARCCGFSRASAYRLLRRYRDGGWAALRDRPSAPKRCPHRLDAAAEQQIIELRRQTGWGPKALAAALGRPASTISRVLVRHGVSRRERQPLPPANRYEYDAVGGLIHLDTKRLGRFWRAGKRVLDSGTRKNRNAGWQNVHVAVDDHSRHVIAEIYPAENAVTCVHFLEHVIASYAARGIRIVRVMTDNGSGYVSRLFKAALRRHDIKHLRTKPYTPRTNGKAEAFIRILSREWAYAFAYSSSADRARVLPGYLRWYNNHRPHGALNGNPPISRLVSQAARSNS